MPKPILPQFPLPQPAHPIIYWQTFPLSALGLVLAESQLTKDSLCLIIVPDPLIADQIIQANQFFQPHLAHNVYFPDWETLPYDHFSPHQDIISERVSILNKLSQFTTGVVITTTACIMHRLPPQHFIDSQSLIIQKKDRLNIDIFRTKLQRSGYYAVPQVKEHGEYAIRGSLIDIFPMGSNIPFRIDLFDNEVDSIRSFSVETQKSTTAIDAIRLLPAKEFPMTTEGIDLFRQNWRSAFPGNPLQSPVYQDISEGISPPGIEYYLPLFFDQTTTLFHYLPKNTTLLFLDDIQKQTDNVWQEISLRYEAARHDQARPLLSPEKIFIPYNELHNEIKNFKQIHIRENNERKYFKNNILPATLPQAPYKPSQPLEPLKTYLETKKSKVLFITETPGRREMLLPALNAVHIHPILFDRWENFLDDEIVQYGLTVAALENGFHLPDQHLILLTESDLYPHRIMQRRLRKTTPTDPSKIIRDLTELQINEPVVHIDHGIGRYLGLKMLTAGGQQGEFLILEYENNAMLYLPISSLHLISRYTGANPETITLNKLGTDQWQRSKRKAAEKVKDVAAELLDLYAHRAARPGFAFQLPSESYAAFCAEFPFEETPDQLRAIEQVFHDMMSERPMDRVICGDVGFGKTEVALRAAFLAAHNSKQVVMLVPTTLLAEQHFNHFQNRLANWPVKVNLISRFKTAKEQKIILEQCANGQIDIIIGTHKLLQSNIKFKNLGLIIIDEEHRFGVKQKEKLKALRTHVDLLTLTATPIPRTLNMALSGIRDLSIIATPPAKRLAVKTFVHEYNETIIQEAIAREILRGGQVYFLHNEIITIDKKADEVRKLIKEARVGVAHGQMHEHDLEQVMSAFYHRKLNVLICSTIIESGIDIPSANTIIINRADKLGLAQLHQLRGRVGRSHHQAYAYLLIPAQSFITRDAEKRLEAIAQLDKLGVGFSLATHDLEIRGAGELLGEEQSGNMLEIGFSLYMELLSRAIEELKLGNPVSMETDSLHQQAEVDLHLPAFIPDDYLGDVQLRLSLYKRIANAETENDLNEIQVEMIDRFGLLSEPIKNLFAIAELKQLANKMRIKKIEANANQGKIEFREKPNVSPEKIIQLIQAPSEHYQLEGPNKLRFKLIEHEKKDRVKIVMELLLRMI